MPDLTPIPFYHCHSAKEWKTTVTSSKGSTHTIQYGATPFGQYQYDYTCTCSSFTYKRGVDGNGYCKHIRAVKTTHCNWQQFIEGGDPVEDSGEFKCPKCNSETFILMYGV